MERLELARADLIARGITPLPRVLPRWLSGLWLAEHHFSWRGCPENVRAELLAGRPLYVITPGGQLLLLRDGHATTGAMAGRTVEVSVSDYVFWSLREASAKSPAPAPKARVPTDPECTECQFSINPCTTHDV